MRKQTRTVAIFATLAMFVLSALMAAPASAASGPPTTLLVSDRCAARLLQQPAFAPSDPGRFALPAYPSGPAMAPAPAPGPSEAKAKAEVALVLGIRFHGNASKVKAAMAAYSDPVLAAVVPDYRLRWAVVAEQGSAGATVLDVLRSRLYEKVEFADIPPELGIVSTATAYAHTNPATGGLVITFHIKYQYEDVLLFSDILAHEVLHQDTLVSGKEELINSYLNYAIMTKLYLQAPWLALLHTELARRINTGAMALINTRDAAGHLRVISGASPTVFPGGGSLAGFGVNYQPLGSDEPGNPALRSEVLAVTGIDVPGINFDDGTVAVLESGLALLKPSELIYSARLLSLQTGLCLKTEL